MEGICRNFHMNLFASKVPVEEPFIAKGVKWRTLKLPGLDEVNIEVIKTSGHERY